MDKFENIIKQAVEGYEAPYNPQAWDNVSNDLGDSFDQMMKDSTGQYEAPYNPAAWEAVSGQLGNTSAVWKWIGGAAAVVTATLGILYITNPSEETTISEVSEQNKTIAQTDVNEKDNASEAVIFDETNNEENDNINNSSTEHVSNNNDANNVVEDNSSNNNENTTTPTNNELVDQTNNTNTDLNNDQNQNSHTNLPHQELTYEADAKFSVSANEVCSGDECSFAVTNPHADLIYIWTYGDGQIGTGLSSEHTYRKAGDFTIKLEVKHPKTNKTIATEKQAISVNPVPTTDFTWEQSNEIIPVVNFINLTDEGVKWNWNIRGLKQSTQNEFEYTFRKAGKYLIDFTAENQFGCSNTAQKTIKIDQDYNLLAPTAFSPNGDFKNDVFIPKALQIMDDVQFTMNIMNKTGEIVYTTQNVNEPWDGIIVTDNTPAPAGSAYIWRVVLTNKNGEKEMYEGQIIVIR